jgi:hypothetical protein
MKWDISRQHCGGKNANSALAAAAEIYSMNKLAAERLDSVKNTSKL